MAAGSVCERVLVRHRLFIWGFASTVRFLVCADTFDAPPAGVSPSAHPVSTFLPEVEAEGRGGERKEESVEES